jgi:hypothetical protein
MLGDASPRVARKARRWLERYLTIAVGRNVWELVETLSPGRIGPALQLLFELPRWDAFDYLLRSVERPEPARTAAASLLLRWRNRSGARPPRSRDAARFRERLATLPERMPPSRAK